MFFYLAVILFLDYDLGPPASFRLNAISECLCGLHCVVCTVWFALCGLHCVVCTVWFALRFSLCGLHSVVCTV